MIQRRQTIWLLLATGAALLSFRFPFAIGKVLEKGVPVDKSLNAGSDFFLMIITGASLILSGAAIFLYKDRKLQIKLCLAGLFISAGIITLFIMQMNKMSSTTLALFCMLPFIILISYFLAFRDIRKDERLVRSLEKIR